MLQAFTPATAPKHFPACVKGLKRSATKKRMEKLFARRRRLRITLPRWMRRRKSWKKPFVNGHLLKMLKIKGAGAICGRAATLLVGCFPARLLRTPLKGQLRRAIPAFYRDLRGPHGVSFDKGSQHGPEVAAGIHFGLFIVHFLV